MTPTLPALERDVGSYASRARVAHGVRPLAWHPDLAAAAAVHARDLVRTGRFAHDGSDGSGAMQRVGRAGPGWIMVGENLAMGMRHPGEAIRGWLDSPPHRANLLNEAFVLAGATVLDLPPRPGIAPGRMWVQVYGTRRPDGPWTRWGPRGRPGRG